jgi:hypothetical protein
MAGGQSCTNCGSLSRRKSQRVDRVDQAVAVARATLGEEAFAAAWEEGKKMTLDEVVAYALAEQSSENKT